MSMGWWPEETEAEPEAKAKSGRSNSNPTVTHLHADNVSTFPEQPLIYIEAESHFIGTHQ